jgi:hypothetical protein
MTLYGIAFYEDNMEQIEVDEQLAAHLRELGYECSGWVVKGGRTITFFPNSRQLRNDSKRFRRTSGATIPPTISTLSELADALLRE